MAEEGSKSDLDREEVLRLAADIVASYVSNNTLPPGGIPELISSVFNTLNALDGQAPDGQATMRKPAVPISKSVTPDAIICLEDGKKLKMLKRHLRTAYGMTPAEYRQKWRLPPDYPMVAPNYAKQRSRFAKKIGLGRKPGQTKSKK